MKEHPLLLSAPMVRATLAGIKRVTRRIPSMRNTLIDGQSWGKSKCKWASINWDRKLIKDGKLIVTCSNNCDTALHTITSIYQPGDVVYFKETWRRWDNGGRQIAYRADLRCFEAMTDMKGEWKIFDDGLSLKHDPGRWKSSMFMNRWMSRIVRPVIGSRFEYLKDITEEQAIAEGMREPSLRDLHPTLAQAAWGERQVFSRLWDHLNADRDGGIYAWSANPLVMPIEFGLENVNV